MKITKQHIRAITKTNFLTNSIARAIVICARSRPEIHTEFLEAGALITFRRRFLHNELSENDNKIVELAEWALDEFGMPGGSDAGKSETFGRAAGPDGSKSRSAAAAGGDAASGKVH